MGNTTHTLNLTGGASEHHDHLNTCKGEESRECKEAGEVLNKTVRKLKKEWEIFYLTSFV